MRDARISAEPVPVTASCSERSGFWTLRAHSQGPQTVGVRGRELGANDRCGGADPSDRRVGGQAMRWYQRFFRRELTEKHLDAELRFHLEQQIADYISAGMKPEEAQRRARLEFGGLDQVK